MANPQTENGFFKIANELFEAMMQHDFSKRQRAIIDLILRLSYGCQRKNAIIPKRVYFERILGIDNSDITRELKKLKDSQVLKISDCKKFYSLNKDYEQWQIKKIKKYNPEEIKELIKAQLIPDYEPVKKVGKTPTNKNKSGQNTHKMSAKSGQNTHIFKNKVGKTPTFYKKEWVKHPHIKSVSLRAARAGRLPKDIKYKYIINYKDKAPAGFKDSTGEIFSFFDQNIRLLTPYYSERINDWINDHSPELVLHVFKHAQDVTKNKAGSPLKLIDAIFKRVRDKNIKSVEEFEAAEKARDQQQTPGKKPIRTESVPDWLKDEDEPTHRQEAAISLEERKKALEAKLKKYKNREAAPHEVRVP